MISIEAYTVDRQAETYQLSVELKQEEFTVSDISTVIPALANHEMPYIILENELVVGFFILDTTYSKRYKFNQEAAIGIRSLLVDKRFQGRGVGSKMLTLLPSYIQSHFPNFNAIQLTVNCRNTAAYHCYIKAGFSKLEHMYLGGPVGPQYILQLKF